MTRVCPRAVVLAVAGVFLGGSTLDGQTVATLELGASVIEYEGFLVSGAALASPSIRYESPSLSVGAQGAWVLFESGNSVLQGVAVASWLSPPWERWSVEFAGSMGASKYADTDGFGHLLGRARIHYRQPRHGAWASAGSGQSFGNATATPVEVAAGAWTSRAPVVVAGSVTSSWLAGGNYVDVVGAARWQRRMLQLDASVGGRTSSDDFGRGAYGEVSALVTLRENLKLALNGGRYPSDPVRGVVGANYFTVGLRVTLTDQRAPVVPAIARAMVQAADEVTGSNYGSRARLEVATSGDPRTLRVYASAARSLEVMGDFTDWQPVQLERLDGETWEIRLPIAPGVHRLNIRIDGGPWLVPLGTRLEETEFGGAVGVVVVP